MKHVYKTTPVSLYDIQSLERWLEERANEGLFPLWVNSEFTQFRRDGTASGTRFRLEPTDGREAPEPERLELYREAGWQYGDTVGKAYFLFYSSDPDAPELHTDPVTRGISLEHLAGEVAKARKRARTPRFIFLGLFLADILLIWSTDPRELPLFFLTMTGLPLILLLLLLLFWRNDKWECRRLLDLQRSLELGITPEPVPPRRRFLPFWISIPLTGLLVILWVGNLLNLYSFPTASPLEKFSGTYVNLQQLESEPLVTYEELFGEPHHKSPGSDWGENTVTRLCPPLPQLLHRRSDPAQPEGGAEGKLFLLLRRPGVPLLPHPGGGLLPPGHPRPGPAHRPGSDGPAGGGQPHLDL